MVAAVVLFGDPYFNRHDSNVDRGTFSERRGGILGERPQFSGRAVVLSYCHSHDPICQGVASRIGPVPVVDPDRSPSLSTATTPASASPRKQPVWSQHG
jgi:hypothetical protein